MKVMFTVEVPSLGKKIKEAREADSRPLTEICHQVGMTRMNWYKIETEETKALPIETLQKIEEVLGVDFKMNKRTRNGQESVWDYPRPPRLESSSKRIQVVFNDVTIADSQNAYRVLETSHPPVYYIPPEDLKMQYFQSTGQQSFCEWKGKASYYTIVVGDKQAPNAAWYYPEPTSNFAEIKNYVAFYPSRMDACYVDEEKVQSQPGDFYGGWITSDIVGPFKGGAGTWGW